MPADLPATSGYTYAAELAIDEADAAGADSVELTRRRAPDARRGQLRRELHRRAGRHRRPDRRLRPHRRGVGAVTGRPRGQGDLRDRRPGRPRHRRRRRQRRRRTTRRRSSSPTPSARRSPRSTRPATSCSASRSRTSRRGTTTGRTRFPQGARRPRLGPDGRPLPDGCAQPGSSTIGCEDQKLGESVDVAGTPYRLAYASDWEPGAGNRSLDVAVTESTLPNGLLAVELVVEIAGQTIIRRYADPAAVPGSGLPPITAGAVAHVVWDGRDGQGQPVIGSVPAHLTLNYYYRATYYASEGDFDASFGQLATGATAEGFPARGCSSFAGGGGPGGLCAVQALDGGDPHPRFGRSPPGRARRLGSRRAPRLRRAGRRGPARRRHDPPRRRRRARAPAHRRRAGGPRLQRRRHRRRRARCAPRRIGPARRGHRDQPHAARWGGRAVRGQRLQRLEPGLRRRSRAPAQPLLPDLDRRAPQRRGRRQPGQQRRPGVGQPDLRGDPDGRLVLLGGSDVTSCPSGNDCRGDGGLAKDAPIQRPDALAVAPDGSVYFVEEPGPTNGQHTLVRRIDPSGIISTVVGGGNESGFPDRSRRRAGDRLRGPRRPLAAPDAGRQPADGRHRLAGSSSRSAPTASCTATRARCCSSPTTCSTSTGG